MRAIARTEAADLDRRHFVGIAAAEYGVRRRYRLRPDGRCRIA